MVYENGSQAKKCENHKRKITMKKRSEEMQTLLNAILAVVGRSKKFSPHHKRLSRGAGWPKFNQLELVTTFTYKRSC